MRDKMTLLHIDLRLFDGAGGAASGTGGGAAAPAGEANPGSDRQESGQEPIVYQSKRGKSKSGEKVVYGKPAGTPGDANAENPDAGENGQAPAKKDTEVSVTSNTLEARRAEFEKLISGEYKDIFAERTQGIIDRRFKDNRAHEARLAAQEPLVQLLAQKYGVADGDPQKVLAALEQDTAYWEQEAERAGMTVEQYRKVQQLQRENEQLRRTQSQQRADVQARQQIGRWLEEAESMRGDYPDLDLQTEIQNKQFLGMLKNGVPVRTAYEVMHLGEIKTQAQAQAAKATERQVVENIRTKGARPEENGVATQGAVTYRSDVSKLTRADREEIARRAARGETIKF